VPSEITIKEAQFKKAPELRLSQEQREKLKSMLQKHLKGKFPNVIDMQVVYDVSDLLKGTGIDTSEIMHRVANFKGNIETFSSPIIMRTQGKRLIEDDFKPAQEPGGKSFVGIEKKIQELVNKSKSLPGGAGYVAILKEDGKPAALIDFGKFVSLETKDSLKTHIDAKGWTPASNITPFLVFTKMHETKKILEILCKAIDESK
jgi:hypothetical protein